MPPVPKFAQPKPTTGHLQPEDMLVFMHVQKTGGSTLRSTLSRVFPEKAVWQKKRPARFLKFYSHQDWEKIRFLSGHFGFNEISHIKRPVKLISIFRDPYERILSYYRFQNSKNTILIDNTQDGIANLLRNVSFDEFLDTENYFMISAIWNSYAKFLAGDMLFNANGSMWRNDQELLDCALNNLKKLNCVGITEDMESSIDSICFNLDIPNFYNGNILNNSDDKYNAGATHDQPQTIELSEKHRQKIEKFIELDLIIYEEAKKLLDKNKHTGRRILSNMYARELSRDISYSNRSLRVGHESGIVLFGPYASLGAGRYRAKFKTELSSEVDTIPPNQPILHVDVVSGVGRKAITSRSYAMSDLRGKTCRPELEFNIADDTPDVEVRLHSLGVVPFSVEMLVDIRPI